MGHGPVHGVAVGARTMVTVPPVNVPTAIGCADGSVSVALSIASGVDEVGASASSETFSSRPLPFGPGMVTGSNVTQFTVSKPGLESGVAVAVGVGDAATVLVGVGVKGPGSVGVPVGNPYGVPVAFGSIEPGTKQNTDVRPLLDRNGPTEASRFCSRDGSKRI